MSPLLLLCEGRCNPLIAVADQLVKREHMPGCAFLPGSHIEQVHRALLYTTHAMHAPTVARCLECGTTRQYGGPQW